VSGFTIFFRIRHVPGAPFLASFARSGAFLWSEKKGRPPTYFFRLRRTGFRKTSQASRYFSYFDRFFRLAG
jgi:hypothetical protein